MPVETMEGESASAGVAPRNVKKAMASQDESFNMIGSL
jgi:hypothetical protein